MRPWPFWLRWAEGCQQYGLPNDNLCIGMGRVVLFLFHGVKFHGCFGAFFFPGMLLLVLFWTPGFGHFLAFFGALAPRKKIDAKLTPPPQTGSPLTPPGVGVPPG